MGKLARINLHLPDDVITINTYYVSNVAMERLGEQSLSYLQLQFKPEFWLERKTFPDHGYLLERAVLERCIRSISFLSQEGQLGYYDLPFKKNHSNRNYLQVSGVLENGSLLIQIGEKR